jgi:hypothetical protein
MPRADGNKLALRIIRAVLDAAHPFQVDVAGVKVDVNVERRHRAAWPGRPIPGLDETVDGPWPQSVELSCSWDGGSVKLRLGANDSGKLDKTPICAIEIHAGQRQLVGMRLPHQIEKLTDGDVASFFAEVVLHKRTQTSKRMPGWSAALKRLVAASALPMSASHVEVFQARIPTCEILPSAEIGFQRLIHVALLKLDFYDPANTIKRGMLVDVPKLAQGGEDESDDEPDDEPDAAQGPRVNYPPPNLILHGPPGTGKTFRLQRTRHSTSL